VERPGWAGGLFFRDDDKGRPNGACASARKPSGLCPRHSEPGDVASRLKKDGLTLAFPSGDPDAAEETVTSYHPGEDATIRFLRMSGDVVLTQGGPQRALSCTAAEVQAMLRLAGETRD